MAVPVQVQTQATREAFAGTRYYIEGNTVPVLHIDLAQMPIYFEHHVLLWKDPSVNVGLRSLKGGFKRMLAGMPIFMTEAHGPGGIAFSRDGVGHVFPMHLYPGQGIDVREHQFLAATASIEFSFQRVKGAANIFLGNTGLFIDSFFSTQQEGILWLYGYGNVFEVVLQPGEQIDVEPGGWIYKDGSVRMDTQFQKLSTGLLAGGGSLFWNRFTGPGRVGIQSMYVDFAAAENRGNSNSGGGFNINFGS